VVRWVVAIIPCSTSLAESLDLELSLSSSWHPDQSVCPVPGTVLARARLKSAIASVSAAVNQQSL
jgi:hypothetical protein